ncbi:hypothetical protein GG344DRAFT_79405 [Lentinula edodes]|nr:hypothetical protein GG344DRAFT_79405 [Lentinula edodes]
MIPSLNVLAPLLLLIRFSLVVACPVPVIDKRGLTFDKIVGFHYTDETAAKEYNQVGTLTSDVGGYKHIHPVPMDSDHQRHWKCEIRIHQLENLLEAPKLFITDRSANVWSGLQRLENYIKDAKLNVRNTIMFGEPLSAAFLGKEPKQVIMFLPSDYLEKSKRNPLALHGSNSLGLRAKCVPPREYLRVREIAEWRDWGIPRWPDSLHTQIVDSDDSNSDSD